MASAPQPRPPGRAWHVEPVRAGLDSQDLRLLAMLAAQRATVVPQVAAWLRVTDDTARRRLRRLAAAPLPGVVALERRYAREPATVTITTKGLRAIGRSQRATAIRWTEHRHDVGVTWLWLAARHGRFGPLNGVRSEREMRSFDARLAHVPDGDLTRSAVQPYAVGLHPTGPHGRRHYPDLLLETPAGSRIAVELELTHKSSRDLRSTMRHYGADTKIGSVLYVTADAKIAARVRQASIDAGVQELVQIRLLRVPARTRDCAPARTAQRTHERVGEIER